MKTEVTLNAFGVLGTHVVVVHDWFGLRTRVYVGTRVKREDTHHEWLRCISPTKHFVVQRIALTNTLEKAVLDAKITQGVMGVTTPLTYQELLETLNGRERIENSTDRTVE